jgi:hypothetical protein
MTEIQAKRASDILQKINANNEAINRLKLDDIDSITFNKIVGCILLNDKNIVENIKQDVVLFLQHEITILKKELENL